MKSSVSNQSSLDLLRLSRCQSFYLKNVSGTSLPTMGSGEISRVLFLPPWPDISLAPLVVYCALFAHFTDGSLPSWTCAVAKMIPNDGTRKWLGLQGIVSILYNTQLSPLKLWRACLTKTTWKMLPFLFFRPSLLEGPRCHWHSHNSQASRRLVQGIIHERGTFFPSPFPPLLVSLSGATAGIPGSQAN